MSIQSEVAAFSKKVEELSLRYQMYQEQVEKCRQEIERLSSSLESYARLSSVLVSIADEQQQYVQSMLEEVVSEGLRTIFKDDISLRVTTNHVGNRTEVDFTILSRFGDEVLETSVLDSRGGGMAAVAGFLIRTVILLLTPGARRTMLLDEAFAQVSVEYEPALSQFIAELCERTGMQVILVTHSEAFLDDADLVYRVSQKEGATSVVRV